MSASHVCRLLLTFTAAASVCLVGETTPVAQEQSRGRQSMPAEAGAQADTHLTIEEAKLSRLIELSTALQRQGRADEALAEAEGALKFAEKNFAPNSIWVGTALVNFSSMLVSRRDLVRAEPLLLRGIEILEQRLGADFDQGASISNFAKSFETLGDVAGAVRLYTLAVKAMERELGPDHPELGRILNSLGVAHRRAGDYRQAARAHERTLAIQEKALGAEHREVATTLNRLAAVLRLLGDLESAERHYAKALKIIEAREGPESVNAAIVTDNLGQVYKDKDDLARAELLHTRALRIFEQTFGAEHQDVATAVNNLASVFADRGDDVQAERLFKRALATREKLLGAGHPQTATVRDNLAVLYQERGDYASAEHLHREALKTIEAAYGPEHPFTSEFVANLAAFYRNMGDYVQAERLYRRALAVVEKTYGPAHRRAAVVQSELAEALTLKGDYVEATHAYRRALNTALEADGPESLLVATILDGLADRYHHMGDKELHDKMHDRSLAIRTKIYGEGDPALLGDYAMRFYREGNLARAEELVGLILAKQEERYGKDDPKVTPALEALGTLYHFQERYEAAARLYARSLAIQEKQLGPHHPEVGHSHFHLSVIRWAQGDLNQSLHLLSRAQEIFEHNLASILATGSDRQKSFYLMAIAPPTSAAITLNVQSALKAPDAARVALTAVLRRKGRSLDAMTDQVGALRRRLDPQDRELFDRLQGARTRLAALAYKDVGHVNAAQFRAQVLRLDDDYNLIGATTSHPSNHWGTAEANTGLAQIGTDYRNEYYRDRDYPAGEQIAYNDQSLQFGGKFDIRPNWSTASAAHAEHRVGINCDTRSNNIPGARWERLNEIFRERGSTRTHDETNTDAPHWHLRFEFNSQAARAQRAAANYVPEAWWGALEHDPNDDDWAYWTGRVKDAQALGYSQTFNEAKALGRSLFYSAEYVGRNRSDEDYLRDLYVTYLLRDPDQGGFNFWLGVLRNDNASGINGREHLVRAFEESGEFAEVAASLSTMTGSLADPSMCDTVAEQDCYNVGGAWNSTSCSCSYIEPEPQPDPCMDGGYYTCMY